MKNEESEILSRLGKDAGFKVPDNYFEQFNERMAQSLPHVTITDTSRTPSLWVRVRPYVYMAAVFAGVWCMMKVFDSVNGNADRRERFSAMAKGIQIESNAEDFIMSGMAADYDLLDYEDSLYLDDDPFPNDSVNQ